MVEKDTSRLLILKIKGRTDCMAHWLEAALFSLEEGWDAGSNPPMATSGFFSFIVFLPFGFLLVILTADHFSFARFLRKRISSSLFCTFSIFLQVRVQLLVLEWRGV